MAKRSSPNLALKAFQAHYSSLVRVIQTAPEMLAVDLFSCDLISREVSMEVGTFVGMSVISRTMKLLDAVYGKISEKCESLDVFLTALRNDPSRVSLADDIEATLKREFT